MDLRPYVDTLRREVTLAAEAGGEEARAVAERLAATLESTTRLVLLEALSDAAAEITRELAPGSVDVRLRGRDPSFVVTSPANDAFFGGPASAQVGGSHVGDSHPSAVPPPPDPQPTAGAATSEADDGATTRINLRLPDALKLRVEKAAGRQRLSVNTWLVRAAEAALEPGADRNPARGSARGANRYNGWVR